MTVDELLEKYALKMPPGGFDIGAGWIALVDDLIANLLVLGWDGNDLIQVKEKFGGLRFYIDNESPATLALIDDAEARSFTICDVCGVKGKPLTHKGWRVTRCADHPA